LVRTSLYAGVVDDFVRTKGAGQRLSVRWLVEISASVVQVEVVGDSQRGFGFSEDEESIGRHGLPEPLGQFSFGRQFRVD
jgi:hypothetical protein